MMKHTIFGTDTHMKSTNPPEWLPESSRRGERTLPLLRQTCGSLSNEFNNHLTMQRKDKFRVFIFAITVTRRFGHEQFIPYISPVRNSHQDACSWTNLQTEGFSYLNDSTFKSSECYHFDHTAAYYPIISLFRGSYGSEVWSFIHKWSFLIFIHSTTI